MTEAHDELATPLRHRPGVMAVAVGLGLLPLCCLGWLVVPPALVYVSNASSEDACGVELRYDDGYVGRFGDISVGQGSLRWAPPPDSGGSADLVWQSCETGRPLSLYVDDVSRIWRTGLQIR